MIDILDYKEGKKVIIILTKKKRKSKYPKKSRKRKKNKNRVTQEGGWGKSSTALV